MPQNPYYAEITLFAGNFAPRGWAFCNGQLLSISQNQALFAILGTTYGGNGTTTFALPDLRGRVPVHSGGFNNPGPGLRAYELGEQGGTETVTLLTGQMPAHNHTIAAAAGDATSNRPQSHVLARGNAYADTPTTTLGASAVGIAGNTQPHPNLQPYLGLNYIIALEGIFPSRN